MLALAAGAVICTLQCLGTQPGRGAAWGGRTLCAPNVIISVDDSGSMDWQVTNSNTGSATITTPMLTEAGPTTRSASTY